MGKIKNYAFFFIYLLFHPRLFLLFLQGIHVPAYLQYVWIKNYPIQTVIDVGAYTGEVSKALHRLLPNATIYAFEPVPSSFAILAKWAKGHNTVVAVNTAISDKIGDALMYVNAFSPASSLLRLNKRYKEKYKSLSEQRKITIHTTSLDDYFKKTTLKPGIFLKVDTQGSELSVLKGSTRILQNVSLIHIETAFDDLYVKQVNFAQIYEYLTERGFIYMGSISESDFYPQFKMQRQQNSIFVNQDFIIT